MRKEFCTIGRQRFSIRKYSIGIASVLLGVCLVAIPQRVSADEINIGDSSRGNVINQDIIFEHDITDSSQVDITKSDTLEVSSSLEDATITEKSKDLKVGYTDSSYVQKQNIQDIPETLVAQTETITVTVLK